MNDKEFWDLIAWANAKADHPGDREQALENELLQLPPSEIEDFYVLYHQQVMAAWTEPMQLVAFLVNGSGDDLMREVELFVFLCWLVDRGKAEYEAALNDPDTLADLHDEGEWGSDGYRADAGFAWEAVTGRNWTAFVERLTALGIPEELPELPAGPVVRRDDARGRFPRLYRRFQGA
jgi:hypothetical protein